MFWPKNKISYYDHIKTMSPLQSWTSIVRITTNPKPTAVQACTEMRKSQGFRIHREEIANT